MAWRVARSLDVLLGQLNTLAPRRNKASDGSIGDADHQNRTSDHNPWYPPPNGGIVTARDFTHDPTYLNMQWVADTLVANRDPRIKYIIWNRRIWTPGTGWRAYTGGPNPHTTHLHLSVVAAPSNDSTALWAGFIPAPPEVPEVELTDPMRPYFPGFWPEEIRAMNVGTLFANMFSHAKAGRETSDRNAERLDRVELDLAELKARPVVDVSVGAEAVVDELIARGVTGGASKEEVDLIVRSALNAARLAVA